MFFKQKVGQKNKRELREQLISALLKEQQDALYEMISSSMTLPKNIDLRQVSVKTIFGFLYKNLFGLWKNEYLDIIRVLENIQDVKEMLDEFIDTRERKPKQNKEVSGINGIIRIPFNFNVSNQSLGRCYVRIHAWRQFINRFCRDLRRKDQQIISEKFQDSFERSYQVYLIKRHAVIRQIKNSYKPAIYFFDQGLGCRFVIVEDNDKNKYVVTVEIPF